MFGLDVLPRTELAVACGYVSKKRYGSDWVNFTSFYEVLLGAKGVEFGGNASVGVGGRKLSYIATVQGNGNLLIGKAYTAMLGLEPGAEFEIKLGKKAIRLIPVGGSDEESEE
ncbi:MAG: AbrB family transcriptional regulator [Synechococcus sp. YX04-3]|nr:MAG: AbrB family transcriptional regulator [Synechococcus sp. YX04-3]